MSKQLAVTYRTIDSLKASPNNPRTHSRRQIQQIARSIEQFGFANPILIDEFGRVLAGHGRVEAAKTLGIAELPTIGLHHLSEPEKRAFVMADNKLAMLSGWDEDLLRLELGELAELEIGFDLEVTGFATSEIDLILGADVQPKNPDDDVPPPPQRAVSQLGDIWQLGAHRLLCGDARLQESYQRLLDGKLADMVFVDPPFNVSVKQHVGGRGRISHEEFLMASGEMTSCDFTAFLRTTLSAHAAAMRNGALANVCMDWRHMEELLAATKNVFSEFLNLCVWNKTNAGLGSLYRSQHELVFVLKNGTAPHRNNVELGRHGRSRSNVWPYAGANSFGTARKDLDLHPTVKPVKLVADAILDATRRGEIVLDGFAGSGSTLIAAERTGRKGAAIELDPKFVDVSLVRYRRLTGDEPRLEETSETYSEVAERRQTDQGMMGGASAQASFAGRGERYG